MPVRNQEVDGGGIGGRRRREGSGRQKAHCRLATFQGLPVLPAVMEPRREVSDGGRRQQGETARPAVHRHEGKLAACEYGQMLSVGKLYTVDPRKVADAGA